MKKILLLLLLIVAGFQGFSQTPGISYQAVILNPNTKELPGVNAQTSILANSNVAVRFTVMNESYEQEYQEYHLTKTDAYGMINLLIGHGTRISGSYFEDILWNGLSKKLKIDIDFSGTGNSFTLLSEQELTFMPQPALDPDYQAILDNKANILAEVERATNAESEIQSDVDANEAASNLADETLQTNINIVQADADANQITTQAALDLKANLASPAFIGTVTGIDKGMVGLGNVDNTSDVNKPVSLATQTAIDANETATQAALDLKANLASPTFTGTVSGVDKGMVGLGNVDNTSDANKPVSTATQTAIDNVQTDVDANETATQAALDLKANLASPTFTGTVSGVDKGMVGLGNVDNTSDANKPVSTATQTALDLKANLDSPTLTGTPLAPTATAGTNTTQIATTAFVNNAVNTATTGSFVDLTTNQTIAGVKTFSNDVIVNSVKIGRGPGNNPENTAVGNAALGTGTGSRNSAFGNGALRSYTGTGFDNNTSIGYNNLPGLTTGSGNTSVGAESMMGISNGTSNTSIGNHSLINTSGNNNVGVGKSSGSTITTGSNNTIIGTEANVSANDQSNSTAIGFQAVVNANNTIQLGNTNVTLVNTSGAITSGGAITGASIVKSGGTSSEYLMADGSVSTGTAPVREVADEFSATASQTSFTLTQTPSVNSKVKMYVNGIRISNLAYSVSGTTLAYEPLNNGGYALMAGDRIQMDFYH